MNKIIIFLFTYTFLVPLNTYALEIPSSIKGEPINVEDLKSFLNIDMFKYKLRLTKGSNITVIFKDIKRDNIIFKHNIEIEENSSDYTMKLSFGKYEKEEGFPGGALSIDNEKINYSLNWNYSRVFSGTISNPLHEYKSIYSETKTFDFGQDLNARTSMMKFYSWEKETDKEELVAEIFLMIEHKK